MPGSSGPTTKVPFAFEAAPIRYADAPERFQSGTPNVPALYAARAGYEIVASIGVDAIRGAGSITCGTFRARSDERGRARW